MNITKLSATAAHHVTAGQNIIDLSTALKELIENSLDASASSIIISLSDHGAKGFEVSDDGRGIAEEDMDLVAHPHATSKIRAFEDLDDVSTFGFRGEALSSLAAVSTLQIQTRTASGSIGHLLDFDSQGNIKSKKPIACSPGTLVRVTNLFESLPVRKAELTRNIKKEYAKMIHTVQGYAVVANGVKLLLYHTLNSQKRIVLSTKSDTMLARIADVFGASIAQSLVPIEGKEGNLCIKGLISKPKNGRGSDRQFFSINGRPVYVPKMCRVANECFRQTDKSKYPAIFVNMTVEGGDVDINVVPDKRQVMVVKEQQGKLTELLRQLLNDVYAPKPTETTIPMKRIDELVFGRVIEEEKVEDSTPVQRETTPKATTASSIVFEKTMFKEMELIGQFNMGFIVTKHANQLYIIDQHAADEIYNFERIIRETDATPQTRISPQLLKLNPQEEAIIINSMAIFTKFGFRFTVKFDNDAQRNAIHLTGAAPSLDVEDVFELIKNISECGQDNVPLPSKLRAVYASKSCRQSIMVGTPLNNRQMLQIISHLADLENPWNCPHGRPVMRHLSSVS